MSMLCWENEHELYDDTLVSTWTGQNVIHCVTCKKIIIFFYHDDKIVWIETRPSNTLNTEISKLLDWVDLDDSQPWREK